MSHNNIYLVVNSEPYKRYVKTVPSMVSGRRLNDRGDGEAAFVLRSAPGGFSYDDEVLEIYSDREDRLLRQANKVLFEGGYLKEYNVPRDEINTQNVLTDEEVVEIASLRNVMQMAKRLNDIDSKVTLKRILDAAQEIGRPQKTLAMISKRLDEIV